MTLAAAFRTFKGGVLLCADRQEDNGIQKWEVDKIYHFIVHDCEIFLVSSGFSALIVNAYTRIHQHFMAADAGGIDVVKDHWRLLKECLDSIYQDYAELQDNPLGLIVVIAPLLPGMIPMVYAGMGPVLSPSGPYVATGSGKAVSDYLAHRLYKQEHGNHFLALVAGLICREVEYATLGVGFGFDWVFIHDGDKSRRELGPDMVKEIQAGIASLEDAIFPYWKEHATLPAWFGR